jgi:hypothetical protein
MNETLGGFTREPVWFGWGAGLGEPAPQVCWLVYLYLCVVVTETITRLV